MKLFNSKPRTDSFEAGAAGNFGSFMVRGKYNQAQYWIQSLQIKEDKKEALGAGMVAQEQVLTVNGQYAERSQIVFTSDDTGHSEEEKGKIQQLYEELQNLPVAPIIVGV